MKIGLFYGSSTCYTEITAEKIRDKLKPEFEVQLYNIKEDSLKKSEEYDIVIYGISTWHFGELQEDWEDKWDTIKTLNLNDKTIALYGLGDQEGYSEWFLDAMGRLYDEIVVHNKSNFIGFWKNENYFFESSVALRENKFVGLALDEDNQYELSDNRLNLWCQQLKAEINRLHEQ